MSIENIANPVTDGDVVLIYVDEKPVFFARVEGFESDKKPKWWQVRLLILQVPLQEVNWILRREQVNGEPFTMQGTPMRIEKVLSPESKSLSVATPASEEAEENGNAVQQEPDEQSSTQPARILSLGGDKSDGTNSG